MREDSHGRFSPTEKLVLLAIAAVLVPAMVLAALQYRQSRELERKTEVAARENLRETLNAIASQTERGIVQFADDVFAPVNTTLSPEEVPKIAEHFSRVTLLHPETSELFVVATCPTQGHKSFSYLFSGGKTRVFADPNSDPHTKWLLQVFNTEQSANSSERDRHKLLFWQASCSCAKRPPVYVFRQIPGGFIGLSMDSDYLQQHNLPKLLASSTVANKADAYGALAFSVLGEDKKEIFATAHPAHYDMAIPFGPVFPHWQLAAGYSGVTIGGLARRNFETALFLDGMMVALLLTGVLLTLRAATREMRLAQAKSSFVSNVSHELKTPLALIRLFAETLELGRVKSKDKEHEYHHIIHNESRRLTQLINNILDFSKIEAGKRQYQFASLDVGSVVQEVLNAYDYQIASSGFDLNTYIATALPPARIDADALAQATLNLLSNAIKYSGDARHIEVRVELRDAQIAIEIADRGIGIPKSEHERIFEKFYRVSTRLVHTTKGSGLGLALVKHIIDAHGGRIVVESAPGKGSRFTILLPVDSSTVATPEMQHALSPSVPGNETLGGYAVAESPNR